MRRSVLLVPAFALLAGCNAGSISMTGNDAGPTLGDGAAAIGSRAMFESDIMVLLGQCASCHAMPDVSGAPGFLVPEPDVYTTLTSWPALINRRDPSLSRLLTKGLHDGPAWTSAQHAIVLTWIQLEIAERAPPEGVPTYLTDPHALRVGYNDISLASLRMPDASLVFRAARTESGWALDDLAIWAGPDGARLTHPRLVTWDEAVPTPDSADQFAGIDLSVAPTLNARIGSGSVLIPDARDNLRISFNFDFAGPLIDPTPGDAGMPAVDGGTPPPSGCRNVDGFAATAAPQFTANCSSCHASRPDAMGALDMTTMGDEASCNQILGRLRAATTPESSIVFLRPDPTSGVPHEFKFGGDVAAFEAFRAQVLSWYVTE